jgi:hypothetical protein
VGPIQKNWWLHAKQFQSSGPAGFAQPFSDLLYVQIMVAPSLQNLKTAQSSGSVHHLVATGKGQMKLFQSPSQPTVGKAPFT